MDSSQLHQELARTVLGSKVQFIEVGKLLYELKQEDNFREAVGDGIDTWNAYLAQPEIGLSISEANRLISIYETFVLNYGYSEVEVAEVPIKNLHYLLPLAKSGEDKEIVDELFQEATHLSQRDFKERVHEHKDDTGVRTYEFVVMKKCIETGTMRKVHAIPSELIKEAFSLDDLS